MKSNRIMWGIVSLVVLVTIAVSFGTTSSYSQRETLTKQGKNDYSDLSRYAVVDYNAPESKDLAEREKRILKNQRYDNDHWVLKNPHPETDGVGRIVETIAPPIIPVAESNLIVVGKISEANAYLSNDKYSVYTEFTVQIKEVLKSDVSNKFNQGDSIVTHRAGGAVRYPNGQIVRYEMSQNALPRVGNEYIFFLTADQKNSNYEILTGFQLEESGVKPLDTEPFFDEFKAASKLDFIKSIRHKVSNSARTTDNQRKKYEE